MQTTKDQTAGLPRETATATATASVTVAGSLAEASFLQWLDRTVLNEWQQQAGRLQSPRVAVSPGTHFTDREMGRFIKLTASNYKYLPQSWAMRFGVKVLVAAAENANSEGAKNDDALSVDTNKEEGKKDGKEGESKSDGERKANPTKGESEVWQDLDNAGNGRKQSGSGSRRRYYEWDHTHNDIEVYDKNGKHQGSMDPTTGEMYKPPVDGRRIKL